MQKTGKFLSMLLSILMLMQVLTVVSYAVEAPTNVHWATEADEWYSEDTEIVFPLIDGISTYKITVYKDGVKVYYTVGGYSSNTGYYYEYLYPVMQEHGYGSYTVTVGAIIGEPFDYEYEEKDDIPVAATSEMSDAYEYYKEYVRKSNIVYPDGTTVAPGVSTPSTPQQNTDKTENSVSSNAPVKYAGSRPGPQLIEITDIYNNDLFEIVGECQGEFGSIAFDYGLDAKKASECKKALYDGYYDGMKLISTSDEPMYFNGQLLQNINTEFVDADGNKIEFIIDKNTEALIGNAMTKKGSDNAAVLNWHLYSNGYMFITPTNVFSDEQSAYTHCYDTVNNIMYKLPLHFGAVNEKGEAKAYQIEEDYEYVESAGKLLPKQTVVKKYNVKLKKSPIVSVFYNNEKVLFDQLPVIENGRTLVPLRAIFEKIGADVQWNGETQTVIATKGNTSVSLTINNTTAIKNGENITLDVPAKIIGGRTLVPVRFVSDCFGVNVEWDGNMQWVNLTSK